MSVSIQFFKISSNILKGKKRKIYIWVNQTIENEKKTTGNICVIITSKKQLLGINKKYLSHNYHTDIVTFNYNENKIVSGDLFISLPQVQENSKIFNVTEEQELLRVIIHGVFHLLGFNDKTEKEKAEMRKNEEIALEKYMSNVLNK